MDKEGKMRDGAVEKIKKLFALAENNPNRNEAIAAALKAQRLMAEHDVRDWELHDSHEQPVAKIESRPVRRRWRWQLAYAVADNFRCKCYQARRHPTGHDENGGSGSPSSKAERVEKAMAFFGYMSDAQAAALTFDYLFATGDRLARRYSSEVRRVYGCADGAYNMFVVGFVAGVRSELEKQSQALMLVVPGEVCVRYEEMTANWKAVDTSLRFDEFSDAEALEAGKAAGCDAIRSRRMDEGATSSRLSAC